MLNEVERQERLATLNQMHDEATQAFEDANRETFFQARRVKSLSLAIQLVHKHGEDQCHQPS
jgi:hypothetical protein